MSSPQINNLILAGCILSYTSVLLMGIDSTLLGKRSSESAMNFICAVSREKKYRKFFNEIIRLGSSLDFIDRFYNFIWINFQ